MESILRQDFQKRIKSAGFAALTHLAGSVFIALLIAILVFGIWYPAPYNKLAGGMELFFLVISVDVVVGPLLTLIIFNKLKPSKELIRDLVIVTTLQLIALGYGVWSVWQARPLFLVAEIDRFKVITRPALDSNSLANLPSNLRPSFFSGPQFVALREPKDNNERSRVLFESIAGGRDYGERPEFYISYEGDAAKVTLKKSRPLLNFLEKYPDRRVQAQEILSKSNINLSTARYLPVISRQDWIALLGPEGDVIGYLKGDGF